MKKTARNFNWRFLALAPAFSLIGGCIVEEHPRRAVYVEPAPITAAVAITAAPPPLREEVVIARPSAEHVWIGGYWSWRENRHVWIAGRWERPPRIGAVWVAPRWEHRHEGYVFVAGFWR